MNDKFYINENGDSVFTAQFLRQRGSCCKSACLHCPYGFTLNKLGLKLAELSVDNQLAAQKIYNQYFTKDDITSSLLGSAFKANSDSKPELSNKNFKVISLKDVVCGIVHVSNGHFKKLYLAEHFGDQGIDDARVRSLL